MSNETVQVTAEWALWGKEPRDVEYRLLRCSDGTLGPGNFEEVITRYSPGTLDVLPQVGVAWLGNNRQNYLAMTIHRAPGPGLYDASGRKVALTYCFCVPFDELAAGPVSYQAMYKAFWQEHLPAPAEGGIKVDLPVMRAPDPGRKLPMVVAGKLLTNMPVCILGADRVDLDTRLAFLDSVMALMPYGMRARLSASTWTNSIFEEHKFRLFFTSAKRQADDHVLAWDPDRVVSIGHDSGDYLYWLSTHTRDKMDLLARKDQPCDFKGLDVRHLVQELQEAWERTSRYEADDPYSSPYAIDESRSVETRPLTGVVPPAEPAADGTRGSEGRLRRRKEKRRRAKERKIAGAGSAGKTGVATRSKTNLTVTRNAQAIVTGKMRYDVRATHDATRRAVLYGLAIVLVAALVVALATVR